MPAADADFRVCRFSSDELPEHDRLPMWHEEFARTLVHVEIDMLSDEPFRASAVARSIPGFGMLSVSGSPMSFNRTRAMAAAGDGSIGLVVNPDRATGLVQRGRELVLDEGSASVILTNEAGRLTGSRHLGLLFPRAVLATRLRDVEDTAMRKIPPESEPLRLLMSYLRALPEGFSLAEPKLRKVTLGHIYDLAAMAIDPHYAVASDTRAVSAARLQSALAFIGRHFDKPGLSVASAAREQGISIRYLQRLIETTGKSFNEHVTELRLQRALALLTSGEGSGVRVAEIALRAGFLDISNFNRSFRRRFGESPTGIRRQNRR